MQGIVPKKVQKKTKEFDSRARRYVFFPIHALDFTGSQPSSPVWKPKMPKGRIVLLEELTYMANAENELSQDDLFSQGAGLVPTSMGTDAQVSYVLSQYGPRGMVELKSIVDLDAESAGEIDELLFGEPYKDMYELKERLEAFSPNPDLGVAELAKQVAVEALASVNKGISWLSTYCTELEREIQEGRAGRRGRTQVNGYDAYMFNMIRRTPPSGGPQTDAQNGKDLIKLLADKLGGGSDSGNAIELDQLQKSYDQSLKIIKEQQKAIEKLQKKKGEEDGE